jgi:hypothetical protein
MAIINKTGITNGGTIQAEHITRAIDALSGVGTDSIIASGSFTGSFTGSAGITNLQIGTNGYFISETSGIVLLNATNNSLDTQIRHRNGIISSSFSNLGLLINAPVRATSFTGSLLGTLTGTASFATTASYALNAIGSGTEYITLTFFHSQVTNTVNGRETYIGGFAALPNTVGPNQIGLVAPFAGDIIYAAATSYASTTGSATVDTDLFIDGTNITAIKQLDLSNAYEAGAIEPGTAVNGGEIVTIRLTETGASSAVWGVNVTVVIKST